MELKKAIIERKSIRGFKPDLVPQETLRQVLELATRAVSAVNSQPWEFAVATGDVLDAIKQENVNCFKEDSPENMDSSLAQNEYRSNLFRDRSVAVAKQLFGAMDIAREDRERQDWWAQRGYRCFDAPAAIILYMDRMIRETASLFDMGCVAQNICLAAMEFGLGTCVAYQIVRYHKVLHRHLGIPDDRSLVTGIAIGYPDWGFPANQVVSQREDVDSITLWHGFK